MKKYKILFIIADGLGDRKSKQLGDRSPLEVAEKPNIKEILKSSLTGLIDPISPGIVPGSDTSHLAYFGLDPYRSYKGRGVFEALGAGAELDFGDVAFRGNFATVDKDLVVIDRRAGRDLEEAELLIKELNENLKEIDGIKVRFYKGTEHRLAVVLSGRDLSEKVSDTDPHEVGKKVSESKPLDNSIQSIKTSNIINKLTFAIYDILSKSKINEQRISKGKPPANIVLLRGASKYEPLPEFKTYTQLNGAAISATALIKGICKAIGLKVVTPEGATGGLNTNYLAKADAAIDFLKKDYDFVFIHYKATDSASHDGNAKGKVYAIEMIDKAIGYIFDKLGSDEFILV
ncbi:MAG: 2,3-bisphosphoglycerate-independent phosphoglycerate mutase, partial [Metallosphaera sp.]